MTKIREKDAFTQKLWAIVAPITMQQLMLALISATDAVMLGLVDQESLSAVSLAGQVQFVYSMVIAAAVEAGGVLVAQYWGGGDKPSVNEILPSVLKVNLLAGGLTTLAALLAPEQLMYIFTNQTELVERGGMYLRAVALSYFLFAVSQVYLCLLKNIGKAAVSSRISSLAVVLNIILNAVLIFGLFGAPRLGIVGAAYATVISRLVELGLAIYENGRLEGVGVRWSYLSHRVQALEKPFFRFTATFLGASVVWGVGSTMSSVVLGHMGSDAVAANSIASIVRTLLFCACRGLSCGAVVLVGNMLGSGNLEQAKADAARLTRLSAVFGAATGAVLVAITPAVTAAAPLEPTAAGYLRVMLLFNAVYVIGKSINCTVLNGVFAAGGDMKFDMQGNLAAMWCFTIPLGFLAAFQWKLPVLAVYCILNLDEIIKVPAVFLHYRRYIWLRDLTQKAE